MTTTITDDATVATITRQKSTAKKARKQRRPKQQPKYHVLLLDDDDHTYDYVIDMLRKLFGFTAERSYQLACEVDSKGRVILETTTLERAEFKRDQLTAFGRDWRITRCEGSMTAIIEPAE